MQKNQFHKLKNLSVLIVEDDETSAEFLKEVLSIYQINTIKAGTADEAVSICRQNNEIDIVLMDIKLPGKNGYQATSEIKRIKKDLPIIAQTANAFETDKKQAFDSGCDGYISKPIKATHLLELIERLI